MRTFSYRCLRHQLSQVVILLTVLSCHPGTSLQASQSLYAHTYNTDYVQNGVESQKVGEKI